MKRSMTQVNKEIETLEAVKYTYTTEIVEEEELICCGFNEFYKTGKVIKTERTIRTEVPKTDEEKSALNKLYEEREDLAFKLWGMSYEDHEDKKYIDNKRRRYEKELKEMKDRIAYIEKWLAEH